MIKIRRVIKGEKPQLELRQQGFVEQPTVKGSGKINVTASGDLTMKGSKINQN